MDIILPISLLAVMVSVNRVSMTYHPSKHPSGTTLFYFAKDVFLYHDDGG